jgi:hypothetical protein
VRRSAAVIVAVLVVLAYGADVLVAATGQADHDDSVPWLGGSELFGRVQRMA